jgi:hypothetical protein
MKRRILSIYRSTPSPAVSGRERSAIQMMVVEMPAKARAAMVWTISPALI